MKAWQICWFVFATLTVGLASWISNSPPIVAVASLSGILFVVLVAYGHWAGNIFGAILAALFGFLSYQAGFFGNATINILFTLPASIWGIYYWKKHDGDRPRTMNAFQKKHFAAWSVALAGLGMWFAHNQGSALWYLDGVSAVLPIVATVLLVCRYKEQWYLWIPYNLIEVVMWYWAASMAPEVLAILVMRIVFLVNSVIGYYLWNKDGA